MIEKSVRSYILALSLLLAAFLARVLIQLLQAWRPVGWLPPFEAWHSATLPYPVLVAAQGAIAALCLWSIWSIATGGMRPHRRAGQLLLVLGMIYFAAMAARLLLGLTVLHRIAWFDAPLPSIFHLVLASFVLTMASFHLRHPGR